MQNSDVHTLYKDGYLLSGGSYKIKGEDENKTHFEKGIKATDISENKALQFFAKVFSWPVIEIEGKKFKLNRTSLKNFVQHHQLIQPPSSCNNLAKLNTENCIAAIKSHIESRATTDNTEELKKKLAGESSSFTLLSKIKVRSDFDIKESTFNSALEALGLPKETIEEIKKKISPSSHSGTITVPKDKILHLLESVVDKITTDDKTLTPFIDLLKKRITEEEAEKASDTAYRKSTLRHTKAQKKKEAAAPIETKPRKLSADENEEIKTLLARPAEAASAEQKFNPDKISVKDIKHHYPKESSISLSDADKSLIVMLTAQGNFKTEVFQHLSFANQLSVALELAKRDDFLVNPVVNAMIKEFIASRSGEESRLLLCLLTSEDYATDTAVQRLNLLLDNKISEIEKAISQLTSVYNKKSSKSRKIEKKSVPQNDQAAIFSKLLLQMQQFKDASSRKSDTQKALCEALCKQYEKSLDAITSHAHFMKLSKDKAKRLDRLKTKKNVEDFFKKDPEYAHNTVLRIASFVIANALYSKINTPDEKAAKIRQIGTLLDNIPSVFRETVVQQLRSIHKNIYPSFLDEYSKSIKGRALNDLINDYTNGSDIQVISSPLLVNEVISTITKNALDVINIHKIQDSIDPALSLKEARSALLRLIPKNPKLLNSFLEPSKTDLATIHLPDAPAETLLSVSYKLLLKNASDFASASMIDKQMISYCFDTLSGLKLDATSAMQFEKLFKAQRDLISPRASSKASVTGAEAKPKVANVTRSLGILSTTRIGIAKTIGQLKALQTLGLTEETRKALQENIEVLEALRKELGIKGGVAENFEEKIKAALSIKKPDADTVSSITMDEIDKYREGLASGDIISSAGKDINEISLKLDALMMKKFTSTPLSEQANLLQSCCTILASDNFKKSLLLLDNLLSILEKQTTATDISADQLASLKRVFIEYSSKQVKKEIEYSFIPSSFIGNINKYLTALEPSFKDFCEDLDREYQRRTEDKSLSKDEKSLYNPPLEAAKSAFQLIFNTSLLRNYKRPLASSEPV